MAEETLGKGRVIYVEPNNLYSDSPSNAIPQAYEDYCITVLLEVDIYDRTDRRKKNTKVYDLTKANFMGGTDGYLSTSYTDVSLLNPGSGDKESLGISNIDIAYNSWFFPQVTITFIDVRGASLMSPQEYALERTLEAEKKENDNYERTGSNSIAGTQLIGGSLFKALFTFPYPEFRLKVKGYYGDGVTFKLCVEKCNIKFNSQTGNFEAVVNFIGSMFGIYTDIPMQLLAIAPYINPPVKRDLSNDSVDESALEMYNIYWDNATKDRDRFYFAGRDVNKPEERGIIYQCKIPTFPELSYKLHKFLDSEEKIIRESEEGMLLTSDETKISELENLRNAYPFVKEDSYPSTVQRVANLSSDERLFWAITEGTSDTLYFTLMNYYDSLRDVEKSLYNDNRVFSRGIDVDSNNSVNLMNLLSFEFSKGDASTIKIKISAGSNDTTIKASSLWTKVKEKDGEEYYYANLSLTSSLSDDMLSYDGEGGLKTLFEGITVKRDRYEYSLNDFRDDSDENKEEIWSIIGRRVKATSNNDHPQQIRLYFTQLNYDILKVIDDEIDKCKDEISEIKKKVADSKGLLLSRTLEFTPTIRNMYKMAFAHLDTFVNLFYDVIDKIDEKIRLGQRHFTLPNSVNIDFPLADRKDFDLPPYTKFFRKERESGTDTYKEFFPSHKNLEACGFVGLEGELDEVVFVRDILEAAKLNGDVQAAFKKINDKAKEESKDEEYPKTFNDIKDFIPLTPYDFNNLGTSYSPYEFIGSMDPKDVVPLSILAFITRLYNTLLFSSNDNTDNFTVEFDGDGNNLISYHDERGRQDVLAESFGEIEAFNIVNKLTKGDPIITSLLSSISNDDKCHEHIFKYLCGEYTFTTGDCSLLIKKIEGFINGKFFNDEGRKWLGTKNVSYVYKDSHLPLNEFNYNKIPKGGSTYDYIDLTDIDQSIISDDNKSFGIYQDQLSLKQKQDEAGKLLGSDEANGVYSKYCSALNSIFRTNVKDLGTNKISSPGSCVFTNPLYYAQDDIYQRGYLFLFSIINETEFKKDRYDSMTYYLASPENGVAYTTQILREGAIYYAEDNKKEGKITFINYPDSFLNSLGENKDIVPVYIYSGFRFGIFSQSYNSDNGYSTSESTSILQARISKNIKVSPSRRKECKKYFTDWIENNYKSIEDDFALFDTSGNLCRVNLEEDGFLTAITSTNGIVIPQFMSTGNSVYKNAVRVDSPTQSDLEQIGTFFSNSKDGDVRKDIVIKMGNTNLTFRDAIGVIHYDDINGRPSYSEVIKMDKAKGGKYNVTHYKSSIVSSVTFNEYIEEEKLLKTGYNSKDFVCDSTNYISSRNRNDGDNELYNFAKEGSLKKGLKKFISSFADYYIGKFGETGRKNSDVVDTVNAGVSYNEDMELAVYNTLSDLYNKWLATNSRETWTIYRKNDTSEAARKSEVTNAFYFIDSFYHDIGDDILVNPTVIDEIMQSHIPSGTQSIAEANIEGDRKSILQYLTLMAQRTEMIFLALPIDFGQPKKTFVENMFKAKPYMKSVYNGDFSKMMSFVCIYTSKPSESLEIKGSQYKNDGFNIADRTTLDPDGVFGDEGNDVPAFGVTYGKQNQSYFTDIQLNMENAQVTEYSIGAMINITSKAAEGDRSTTLFGQDLYRVYSNYSYQCNVEMLGCAQIVPLMYFQLNNVPMWKGAYMITNVKHHISPGVMKTSFTGIRVSRYMVPYTKPIPNYVLPSDISQGSPGQDPTYETTANNNKPINTISGDTKEPCEGLVMTLSDFIKRSKESGWDEADAMRTILTAKKCNGFPTIGNNYFCARWTYRHANALTKGTTNICNLSAGGDAWSPVFMNNLVSLGYTKVDFSSEGMLTTSEMKNILDSDMFMKEQPYGAIIVYVSDNGSNKNCEKKYHATIYLGNNKLDSNDSQYSRWWCDRRYRSNYVYNKLDGCNYKWNAYGFIPPKKKKTS